MSKIAHIKLENLTAFRQFEQDFSSGVNILIGVNGTGKTHLLKTLYSACAITIGEDREKGFGLKLRNVFNPYEGRIGRISRRQSTSVKTRIAITREGGIKLTAEFSNHTKKTTDINVTGEVIWQKEPIESAFIPVKEMLAHAPGFLATLSKRELNFEEIYPDIIKRAYLPKLMGATDQNRSGLFSALQKAIDGKVIAKGEHFFLRNKQGDLEFTLLAEGIRKLALIWLLIQNGTLLSGVLFWDEPEANLNPSLIGEVVEIILELQRLGVQIFMTTHNYVILKEFDLRKKQSDAVRYISLFRDESESVISHSSDTYSGVDQNAIADTFVSLYNRDITRALKGDNT
jgi:energy-coupling factor transporter ATP-binding protein EcfA2